MGEYKKNEFHGEGVYYLPNGEKYKGVFRDGDFHEGTWTNLDGYKFEGEFKDGTYYRGTLTQPDGGKYEGEFSEGMFHGRGIKYDPDGEIIHDGEWSFDEPLN